METSTTWPITVYLLCFFIAFFPVCYVSSLYFEKTERSRLQMLFNNLAFMCIPVIVIGVFDRLFLMRYFLEDTKEVIKKDLLEPFDSYVTDLMTYGVKDVNSQTDLGSIFRDMEKGGSLLILDTMLCDFDRSISEMRSALDRGVKLRVLTVHPAAQVAEFRAGEIDRKWGYTEIFSDRVIQFIMQFQGAAKDHAVGPNNRVEMRYYEHLPCMPMYILDNPGDDNDKLYHGYFLGDPASQMPLVEIVPVRGGLYDIFLSYFDQKWERNADNVIDQPVAGLGDLPPPKH